MADEGQSAGILVAVDVVALGSAACLRQFAGVPALLGKHTMDIMTTALASVATTGSIITRVGQRAKCQVSTMSVSPLLTELERTITDLGYQLKQLGDDEDKIPSL